MIPEPDHEALSKLDAQVADIAALASAFTCANADDYQAGAVRVLQIRNLDKFFEDIYKPIKKAHDAAKAVTLDEERRKRAPLDEAKRAIGSQMLAWKAAEEQREKAARQIAQAAAKRQAEERVLAQAVEMAERGAASGNQTLQREAERLLDRPLQHVLPVSTRSVVPKVAGVKTVERLVVEITDLPALLMAVGVAVDQSQPHPVRSLDGLLDNETTRTKLAEVFATILRPVAQFRGDAFHVPGVVARKKDGLG